MERKAIVLCGIVGLLGLLSAATGFAAEATRITCELLMEDEKMKGQFGFFLQFAFFTKLYYEKGVFCKDLLGSEVQFISPTQCSYPRTSALGLGLTAAVSLMVAQIIINAATGCICCRRSPYPSNRNWRIALICFALSWFTFVIAFLLLLTGAALNDQHGEESMYFGNYYCYVVKPGVFAGGAILAFASSALGIVYYLTLNSAKDGSDLWVGGTSSVPGQGGIAMGQPQFPPPHNQEPVFVHEDTYMRRQFT